MAQRLLSNFTPPGSNGTYKFRAGALFFGTTSGSSTAMTVSIPGVTEYFTGLTLVLTMGVQSATNCTLKVNDLDPIKMIYGAAQTGGYFTSGATYIFVYDGTNFKAIHSYNSNTTYGSMSVSEGTTGTATSNRVLTATNLKQIINAHAPTKTGVGASGDNWNISITKNAATATKFQDATNVTLTGDVTGSSSSQRGWNLNTTIGEGRVTNSMLAGSISNEKLAHSYFTIKEGSINHNISLGGQVLSSDLTSWLGLSKIMSFVGISNDTALVNGYTGTPKIKEGQINYTTKTPGDTVLHETTGKQFIWTGTSWYEMGNGLLYDLQGTAAGLIGTLDVSEPAANGTGITFIDTASQSNGKISVTKKTVRNATTGQTGVLQFTAANTNTQLNQLTVGSSTPTDNDYFISQYAGGGTTTTTYHRRPVSALAAYMKQKLINGLDVTTATTSDETATTFVSSVTQTDGKISVVKSPLNTSGTWSGNAGSASKLTTSAGSSTRPIYFSGGVPVQCGNSLAVSVTGSAGSVAWGNVTGKPSTFTPSSHTHSYLPLSGGTMTGQIQKASSSRSWYNGRDSAIIRNTATTYTNNQYNPLWSVKSINGTWDCGSYTADNSLYFTYITDANYNSGTNTTTQQIYFNGSNGGVYAKTFVGALNGNASSASKLNTNAGSSTRPIYFSGGVPVQCGTSLAVSITGSAASAAKLTTARKINGTDFNGTADITTTKWGTSRTLTIGGKGKAVDGSSNVAWTLAEIGAVSTSDLNNYLPLSAGSSKKLTGPLGLTANVMYGTAKPTSGFEGQLFFVEDNTLGLPTGGSAGQALVKNSNTHGDASWKTLNYLPLSGGTLTGQLTVPSVFTVKAQDSAHEGGEIILSPATSSFSTIHIDSYDNMFRLHDGENARFQVNMTNGYAYSTKLYGAVWNDYAEYRSTKEEIEPGRCIVENGDDTLSLSTKRLQRGCEIVSDTFGFAIGETKESKTPIAASGRVLAYPYESREEFAKHIGWPVCSGPNGTVSIMTEEEEEKYPSRIIGIISAVPDYEEWGTGKVKVNGRIWIRVK